MKQKSNNKKINKYLTGGKVNTYVENPSDMLSKNSIMLAQAQLEAETDPMIQGLNVLASLMGTVGNGMVNIGGKTPTPTKTAKYGGKVPVEVEGGEVAETPTGNFMKFNGPSHENGGIDISLPPLTEIYSKRISIDGKTMAERKQARENLVSKYSKKFNKTGDAVYKNTLDRATLAAQVEEELDKKIQETIHYALSNKQPQQEKEKHEFGNKVDPLLQNTLKYQENKRKSNLMFPMLPNDKEIKATDYTNFVSSNKYIPKSIYKEDYLKSYADKKEDNKKGIIDFLKNSNVTGGDILGVAGNLYQSFAPYINTLRSRAEDTPNINPYKGFGQDALKANEESMKYAQGILDNILQEIELSSTASKKSLRNSASGVNTMRATDIASETGKNSAQREAYNQFAQMMINNFQQKSQLENIQDQFVMGGEEKRDIADRQDREAFRTNIGQDKINIGKGVTEVGKFLNKSKENDTMKTLLESIYENNGLENLLLNYDINSDTAKVGSKSSKSHKDMIKNGTWKNATDNPNTKDGKYKSLAEFKRINKIE